MPTRATCLIPATARQGSKTRIASLLAADLHADLHYTWNLGRRSFFRRTLMARRCDVVISVPAALPIVATTLPYFSSSYVFVTRRTGPHIVSFDDPALRTAKIGLPLLGAEGANTPPAMALALRGITGHITGFSMWNSEDAPDPQGKIVAAVASGAIDVAIVWGPVAGYFAKAYGARLQLDPVTEDPKMPAMAFSYDMAMGVRKDDLAMRDRLQQAIDRHRREIDAILASYGVPHTAPTRAASISLKKLYQITRSN